MPRVDDDEKPILRGIFAFEDEENPEWRRVVSLEEEGGSVCGGVPKFATKLECEEFIKKTCWRGSNPDFPYLQHVFSMLVEWKQIQEILIPKIEEYDRKYPPMPPGEISPENRFLYEEGIEVTKGVDHRVNLPFHQKTNRESTMNTLRYLFFHMRCGIFVMIRRSKVVLFVPFVNKDYENNWGNQIQFDSSDGSMYQYYCEKQNFYRRENIIPDPKKWWANGNIICNEHCRYRNKANETQYWGDQFLTQLRDMLEDACQHRNIPDCEFFINKRDYPHLKENLSEPYGFLFDRDDQNPNEDLPLTRHRYNSYAPIMSFYISKRFADIPFPCSEDWEAATGLVFPQTFKHSHCDACPCGNAIHCEKNWECFCEKSHHGIESARDLFTTSNFIKFYKPWEEKINTAFFRGSATGGGTEVDTNQRLHLAQLSNQWKQDIRYNGQNHDVPFLNAEITTWNLRDKKIAGKPMTFIRTNNEKFVFEAGKKHFIPIYEQSKYKYLLYVEGHCAANRYAFLMRLGSVILKVSSRCVANEMWYFPLLKPYEDHIPIQEDLSNLAEQIQWCRDNDDKCRQIAIRAKELYEKYISKKAIHDYLEIICHRVAQRFEPAPQWYKRPSYVDKPIKKPSFSPSNGKCVSNRTYCKRCLELKKEKEEQEQDEENRRKQLKGSFDNRRSSYYDRFDSYRDNTQKRQPPGEKIPQCRKCRRAKNACICH